MYVQKLHLVSVAYKDQIFFSKFTKIYHHDYIVRINDMMGIVCGNKALEMF